MLSVLVLGFMVGCSEDESLVITASLADPNNESVTFSVTGMVTNTAEVGGTVIAYAEVTGNAAVTRNVSLHDDHNNPDKTAYETITLPLPSAVDVEVCGVTGSKLMNPTPNSGVDVAAIVEFTKDTDTYALSFNEIPATDVEPYWTTESIRAVLITCPM